MTDKQLEKLIKQGGIVGNTDEHIAIKLDPNIHEIFYPWDCSSECLYEKDLTLGKSVYKCKVYDLEKISKKDFDKITWYNKTHAERTERFEPPMWKDLDLRFNYTFNFVVDNRVYVFFVTNFIGLKSMYGAVHFKYEITKENYEKACEIVRDLFKGGKNENIKRISG